MAETKFQKVSSQLIQCCSYKDQLFGISQQGVVWEWTACRWKKLLGGQLTSITAGEQGIWGIDIKNQVFQIENENFIKKDIKLKQILSGKNVYGVSSENTLMKVNSSGNFIEIDGYVKIKQIVQTTPQGKLFALSTDNSFVCWTENDSTWSKLEGKEVKSIHSHNDLIYGIDKDEIIWIFNGKERLNEDKKEDKKVVKETKILKEGNKQQTQSSSSNNNNNNTNNNGNNNNLVSNLITKQKSKSILQVDTSKTSTSSFGSKKELCFVCNKTVFPIEKISIDGRIYHNTCFKCTHCKCTLTMGNYAQLEDSVYCKPHLLELFKRKGKYDFGKKGSSYNENEQQVLTTKSTPVNDNNNNIIKQEQPKSKPKQIEEDVIIEDVPVESNMNVVVSGLGAEVNDEVNNDKKEEEKSNQEVNLSEDLFDGENAIITLLTQTDSNKLKELKEKAKSGKIDELEYQVKKR